MRLPWNSIGMKDAQCILSYLNRRRSSCRCIGMGIFACKEQRRYPTCMHPLRRRTPDMSMSRSLSTSFRIRFPLGPIGKSPILRTLSGLRISSRLSHCTCVRMRPLQSSIGIRSAQCSLFDLSMPSSLSHCMAEVACKELLKYPICMNPVNCRTLGRSMSRSLSLSTSVGICFPNSIGMNSMLRIQSGLRMTSSLNLSTFAHMCLLRSSIGIGDAHCSLFGLRMPSNLSQNIFVRMCLSWNPIGMN